MSNLGLLPCNVWLGPGKLGVFIISNFNSKSIKQSVATGWSCHTPLRLSKAAQFSRRRIAEVQATFYKTHVRLLIEHFTFTGLLPTLQAVASCTHAGTSSLRGWKAELGAITIVQTAGVGACNSQGAIMQWVGIAVQSQTPLQVSFEPPEDRGRSIFTIKCTPSKGYGLCGH